MTYEVCLTFFFQEYKKLDNELNFISPKKRVVFLKKKVVDGKKETQAERDKAKAEVDAERDKIQAERDKIVKLETDKVSLNYRLLLQTLVL